MNRRPQMTGLGSVIPAFSSGAPVHRTLGKIVAGTVGSVWARLARAEGLRVGVSDLESEIRAIIARVWPYTLTSTERLAALCASVDYVVEHDIEGAFVECGLWKGGSLLAILLRLHQLGVADRQVVGFDTFTGMTEASELDIDYKGDRSARRPAGLPTEPGTSREAVAALMATSGYPPALLSLVAGPAEETLPGQAPPAVALLRLDTDWYASTRHELEHLYPRLAVGGVLIIDDYGHFKGARKAVDEYFGDERIFLQRVDYAARLAIKQEQP
jgi:hypothetical protein